MSLTRVPFYNQNPSTAAITQDFARADQYGLTLIPAMVVEEKHIIQGTKRTDLALNLLKNVAEEEGLSIFDDNK